MDRQQPLPGIRSWGSLTDLRTGVRWSPALVERHVAARCARMVAAGLEREDPVFILHDNRAHFLVDLLAVWAAGGWAVGIDPRRPADEIEALADELRPKLWLDAGEGSPDLPGAQRIHTPGIAPAQSCGTPGLRLPAADRCGVVLLSSGTAGTPKAIRLPYRAICARIALNLKYMGRRPGRTLCLLPTHFGHGLIGNCLTPWSAGSDLVLADGGDLSTLASLGRIIDDHRVDFMSSVPSIWRIVLDLSAGPERHGIGRIHIGSAPLIAPLWARVIEWSGTREVVNTYGLTETANWVAGASASEFEPEDGLVGRPWGVRAAVRNPEGTSAARGAGEIVLRLPWAAADSRHGGPGSDDWLRTGDIGSIGDDGVIRLLGRIDHIINRAGVKIRPEETEWQVERHPAVAEACAFAVPHPQAGQTVGLAVRLRAAGALTANALRGWCARRVRPEAVPEHVFFLAALPRNVRGKVDRHALIQHCRIPPAGD